MVSTSFDLAANLFNRSFEPSTWAERITDLATALEATLISGDPDRRHSRNRSSDSILATDGDPAAAIEVDVNELYDLRSQLVHGASISEAGLRAQLETVSTVPAGEMFGVVSEFAVDRLHEHRSQSLPCPALSRTPT